MTDRTATALAHPNIAFIKYWGNVDAALRIPSNGSISMNLGGLHSRTRVSFDPELRRDRLILNGRAIRGPAYRRVCLMLDRVRALAGLQLPGCVQSRNNFPTGAGIASSASAFAALSVAAAAAAGLELSEQELSRLARTGSGSACRSVPAGFVEWQTGSSDQDSYAISIAPPEHWALVDCVAIVSQVHKPTGSSEGHALAPSSPLQQARLQDSERRLAICRSAIRERDFESMAEITELDSNMMHAVMMTSTPRLLYWEPATVAVMQAVTSWRKKGLPCFYTIDAGPNVHVLCPAEVTREVSSNLRELAGVSDVLVAPAGGPAHVIGKQDSS